jgi:hypothetical protein
MLCFDFGLSVGMMAAFSGSRFNKWHPDLSPSQRALWQKQLASQRWTGFQAVRGKALRRRRSSAGPTRGCNLLHNLGNRVLLLEWGGTAQNPCWAWLLGGPQRFPEIPTSRP